jgi:hypothetical protein
MSANSAKQASFFAAEMAPHRNSSLPPQMQQPKTAGANSKLDKTWGQGHLVRFRSDLRNPGALTSSKEILSNDVSAARAV